MRTRSVLSLLCLNVAMVVACGSAGDDSAFQQGGVNSSSGASGASGGEGSSGFGSSGASSGASGSSGATCAAVEAQTSKGKVDIVFLIDNSGSMTDEMVQVKTNVNTFANAIGKSGLDFHVVFIVRRGTSGNTICVPPPLGGAACADNLPTFHHVDQSVGSNNSLALALSTYESANPALAWKGDLRPDAFKVFVEVSDDEARGTLADAFDTALLDPAKAGMFGTGTGATAKRNYLFHSIVNWKEGVTPPTAQRCSTRDGGTGVEYQKLSLLTGGIIDAVCKTDYSGVLNNIAKGIVDRLACDLSYPKNEAADPTKLVVQYTPTGKPGVNLTQVTDASKCAGTPDGWHYDDNANPTKITLCKSQCDEVNNSGGKISALVGCRAPAPK